MTVAAATTETVYQLGGSGYLGPYATAWTCEQASDVVAYLDTGAGPVTLASPLITVTIPGGDSLDNGAAVMLAAALLAGSATFPAGTRLILDRATADGQPSALGDAIGFSPEAYEAALDHAERQIQDLRTQYNSTGLRGPPGSQFAALPAAAGWAGKYLGGDPISGAVGLFQFPSFVVSAAALLFATATSAALATIPAGMPYLRTQGYAAVGDRGGALYAPAAPGAGPGKFQSADLQWWGLVGEICNPFQFGANPAHADDTTIVQAMFAYAGVAGMIVDGLNAVFNVSQVTWTPGVYHRDLSLKSTGAAMDLSVLVINGVASPVSGFHARNLTIDGNRVAHTGMVGDGKRQGLAINGRVNDVFVDGFTVRNCATDNFRSDAAGVASASDTDYLQTSIVILKIVSTGAGRWGGSGMSLMNAYFQFVQASINGQNLPGYPAAPYGAGGNGRTFNAQLNGGLYGGGFDCEDEAALGGGFLNLVIDIANAYGNAGAACVVSSDVNPTTMAGFVTRKNVTVRVNGDCGRPGVGLGTVSVENNVYTGPTPTFENVLVEANVRSDPLVFSGVSGLVVRGLHKSGAGSTGANAVIASYCTTTAIDIVSDSIAGIYVTPLPDAPTTVTQISGAAWTSITGAGVALVDYLPGGMVLLVWSAVIKPSAAGTILANLAFPPNATISSVSTAYTDQNTGAFLQGGETWPTATATTCTFGFTAGSTDPVVVKVAVVLHGL